MQQQCLVLHERLTQQSGLRVVQACFYTLILNKLALYILRHLLPTMDWPRALAWSKGHAQEVNTPTQPRRYATNTRTRCRKASCQFS